MSCLKVSEDCKDCTYYRNRTKKCSMLEAIKALLVPYRLETENKMWLLELFDGL